MDERGRVFVVVGTGSVRAGFPEENVRAIKGWSEPLSLPRSAGWLRGLLIEEGQAVPVLMEDHLGGRGEAPEVVVLLEARGRLLAVSGRAPRLVRGELTKLEDSAAGTYWSGELSEQGESVRAVDVEKLYTALGLHYNETGCIGGLDDETYPVG